MRISDWSSDVCSSALVSALLFGIGLTVSQMVNPAKVLNFLDLAGNWDPSLAFVLGGAVATAALGFRLVRRRTVPLLAGAFQWPTARDIDRRLVLGAALFGVDWSLVGFCQIGSASCRERVCQYV